MAKGFDSCEQTLKCIKKLANSNSILYTTNLRTKLQWDDNNFEQLADDLKDCFAKAKHPIPKPLSRPALAGCDSTADVCKVVAKAFK